ncbi:MAG: 30S ribosomal protein S2 [Hyphomicrobiales bacterium]|nr:30S ribosomal protein S2 [Hyphomicrobiales bacterium]
MALPAFNMRQLLEAGVHFGHQTHRWNPKMGAFIFGTRNKIHIIDLAQTVPLLHQALVAVSDTVAQGGRVLFVGTKRQASEAIAASARRSAQYYVNHRWLGGTLTNWKTISNSIKRLRTLEELLGGEGQGLTKKELLGLTRERDKLERALGGIKDMGGVPDLLFVIDTNKESIAVAEARKLKIPVIAVVDSNCDPDDISHPIPGNDDAGRAITLYCDLIAKAAIDGIERAQGEAGIDVGAQEEPLAEEVVAEPESAPAPQANGDATAAKAPEVQPEEAAKDDAGKADETETEEKAAASGFEPLKQPDGEADDLKKIGGLGPVLEKKLNEYGIYHFRQIAALKKADIAQIDEALDLKGRIERDDWLKQAKDFMKEKA